MMSIRLKQLFSLKENFRTGCKKPINPFRFIGFSQIFIFAASPDNRITSDRGHHHHL